jgi:hypothetical protein
MQSMTIETDTMKPVTILVPKSLYALIKYEAEKDRRSVSRWIVIQIEKALSEKPNVS